MIQRLSRGNLGYGMWEVPNNQIDIAIGSEDNDRIELNAGERKSGGTSAVSGCRFP